MEANSIVMVNEMVFEKKFEFMRHVLDDLIKAH